MLRSVIAIFKKMTSRNQKKTLSQKLGKGGRVEEFQTERPPTIDNAGPQDIEDTVVSNTKSKSKYFSPIQTRHRRKISANQTNVLEPNEKKLRQNVVSLKHKVLKPSLEKAKIENCDDEKPKASVAAKTDQTQWEPAHWQQVLENIRKMRTEEAAPVDSMGCDKCADEGADDKTKRYQKLVALMLSSQTKDETTFQAMDRLKQHTLTPASIANMKTHQLEAILHPVSFYKNKAKYLQNTSRILIEKYANDIPNNVQELLALPGVGPKMAHICMATAWNKVTGIGVDVHVHRIVNRLGWVPVVTKDPERTRTALEQWLPKDLWQEVNHLLVGFGQTTCTVARPNCEKCMNRDICPASNKPTSTAANTKNNLVGRGKLSKTIMMPLKKKKLQI